MLNARSKPLDPAIIRQVQTAFRKPGQGRLADACAPLDLGDRHPGEIKTHRIRLGSELRSTLFMELGVQYARPKLDRHRVLDYRLARTHGVICRGTRSTSSYWRRTDRAMSGRVRHSHGLRF